MVADLTRGPGSTEIGNAVAFGNRVFLEARAGLGPPGQIARQQVWVSDGTARGTKQLTHFTESSPFSHGISAYGSLSAAAAIGNRLFFPANETGLGRELWTTDGTAKGTHLVADLCPGSCSGVGAVWPAFQNRIYFTPGDPSHGAGLWVTDGTAAGTHVVRDLCPGLCISPPSDPFPFGGVLLFSATADPAHNPRQVWKTDGTAAGTLQLSSLPGNNFLNGLQGATAQGKLFFAADDGVHGLELWVTDGTAAGTRLAANIDGVDHGGSKPDSFMAAGGILYFFADDGVHGTELWKSDGTAGGTELVHEFVPGPGSLGRIGPVNPRADLDGILVFPASLGLQSSLWRTDGTDAGTYALTPDDVRVNDLPLDRAFHAAGGKVAFFLARRPASGDELWVTDGTLAGTRELDLVPGSSGSQPNFLTPFGDRLVFLANTSVFGAPRLWVSDGTGAGTAPVTDAVQPAGALTVHQGLLYFLGTDESNGSNRQLWRSDGTAAGTVRLPDLLPGRSLFAQSLTSLGSRLLLWDAFKGTSEAGLWATDGTAAGTQQISSVLSVPIYPGPLELGGVVYFGGTDGHSELLWRTDGTGAGTYPLRGRDGQTIAAPAIMTLFDGKLYLITPDLGATLWQSDGTPQGTFPLRQLEPGQRTSLALGVAGSRLFFRAFDPATGSELWAINGQ
jgi:ELWxxDGT repeat protein